MRAVIRSAVLLILLSLALAAWALRGIAQPTAQSFASRVERLSEEGGDFDTDNLISNERSYLDVVPALKAAGVSGGAYIGVGPDQNFSYIAQIRPAIAFIIDIRRDNLLLHLLFKSLFASAQNRVEYLGLLTGRPLPDRLDTWRDASLERIVAYIDGAKPIPEDGARLDRRVHDTIAGFGVPLTAADFATIQRFHHSFVNAGLSLKFESRGRRAAKRLSDASRSPARHGSRRPILELPGRRSPISSSCGRSRRRTSSCRSWAISAASTRWPAIARSDDRARRPAVGVLHLEHRDLSRTATSPRSSSRTWLACRATRAA